MTRPELAGPDHIEPPFPVVADTFVEAGFGRGSSELGIPTANIPPGALAKLEPGVYYGWAAVSQTAMPQTPPEWIEHARAKNRLFEVDYGSNLGSQDGECYPMVMSIGWNPFYDNKLKSAEVHIMKEFKHSFYGARIKVAVLGFIRNERSYESLDELIDDIHFDIKVAEKSLARPEYIKAKGSIASIEHS